MLRAREFVFWRKHKAVWRSGYGVSTPGIIEYGFEAIIRMAELLGVGLLFAFFEGLFGGNRYRTLNAKESAFAKTYFEFFELESIFLDEGAKWVAGKLKIAFVAGFCIKTNGRFTPRLLIHELVHVRQFRRWGWAYVAKALMAQLTGDGYDVPLEFALPQVFSASAKTPIATFHPLLNAEQEARRLEEWVMWRMRYTRGLA